MSLFRSHICRLESTRLSPSCEIQRISIEMIQMSHSRTPDTEKDILRKGY